MRTGILRVPPPPLRQSNRFILAVGVQVLIVLRDREGLDEE